MKTKTTTREYDGKGKLVKETVVEYETTERANLACTCAWLRATLAYCPVHGYVTPYQPPFYSTSGIVTLTPPALYRTYSGTSTATTEVPLTGPVVYPRMPVPER